MEIREDKENGFGILEVLIFSSILLIIFYYLMNSLTNFNSFLNIRANEIEKNALKNYLNKSVSCEKSMKNIVYPCTEGESLGIWSSKKIIIKSSKGSGNGNNFTKIGDFQVRAICTYCSECDSGYEIDIESRHVTTKNKPKSEWESVFGNVGFPCSFELWDLYESL